LGGSPLHDPCIPCSHRLHIPMLRCLHTQGMDESRNLTLEEDMRRGTKVLVAIGLVVVLLAVTVVSVGAAGRGVATGTAVAWRGEPGSPPFGGDSTMDAVSKLLGISEETIVAERQEGKSLAQIAEEREVSREILVAAILEAKKASLDTLINDGTLTQERADTMYANMQTTVSAMVDRTGPGVGSRTGAGLGCGMEGSRAIGQGVRQGVGQQMMRGMSGNR
jgi:hypothetical protein